MDDVIGHMRDAKASLRAATSSLEKARELLSDAGRASELQKRLRLLGQEAHDVMLRVDDELEELEREQDAKAGP